MKRVMHLRERGLSLVELLVGLAIAVLVLAPLAPMLQTASAAAHVTASQAALEQEAGFVIGRISARIRASAPSQLGANPADWFKPAVYSVSNRVLTEQQGKEKYVLSESVSDFRIAAPASADAQPLIQVDLTLERVDAGTNAVVASATASATVRMGSGL